MKTPVAPPALEKAWSRLCTAIEARSHRERWVLLVLLVVITGMITHHYSVQRIQQATDSVRAEIATLESEYREWTTLRRDLEERGEKDPQASLQQRAQQLEADRHQLQEDVRKHLDRFIEPERVNSVLRTLMQTTEGLQFLHLVSLPPQPLDVRQNENAEPAPVFRRGVEVHFRGTYRGLIRWIDRIEAQPWIVQWDRLRIERDDPDGLSRFSLRIYTLTLDEDWIRV